MLALTWSGVPVEVRERREVEHAIARLKNWRVLRDHRCRGQHLASTVAAFAFLHNLQVEMRDNP